MALQDILYWPISGCHTHVFDFDANPNKTHSQLTSLLNYVILGCRPHFFFCISASLQIVKIKIMNYSIQFQRMVEKKQNGSSSINPAPLARPCLLPAHVRFAEWKHTIALFTGGVRWRRYRHSIKFVYSLHEYEYERGLVCGTSHTNNTINWPKSRECTTWDFHLFFFSWFFAAEEKTAAPIPADQIVIHNHVSIYNRRWRVGVQRSSCTWNVQKKRNAVFSLTNNN